MNNPFEQFMNPFDKVYSEITGIPCSASAAASDSDIQPEPTPEPTPEPGTNYGYIEYNANGFDETEYQWRHTVDIYLTEEEQTELAALMADNEDGGIYCAPYIKTDAEGEGNSLSFTEDESQRTFSDGHVHWVGYANMDPASDICPSWENGMTNMYGEFAWDFATAGGDYAGSVYTNYIWNFRNYTPNCTE